MKLFDMILFSIFLVTTGFGMGAVITPDIIELTKTKQQIYTGDTTEIKTDGTNVCNDVDTFYLETSSEVVTKKDTTNYNFQIDSTEYFAFSRDSFDYNYEPIKYTEYELLLFTNILYRESRDHSTLHTRIDQYFVCIAGIQRILCQPEKFSTVYDMVFHSGSFSYEKHILEMRFDSTTHPRQYKNWMNCQKVVKNVLERTIPDYVPYLPKGTFCYWNSRIDTNTKQRNFLETKAYSVASTIWNHHYYVIDYYCDEKEKEYLIRNGLTCNPIIKNGHEILGPKKFAKPIKSGILCNPLM